MHQPRGERAAERGGRDVERPEVGLAPRRRRLAEQDLRLGAIGFVDDGEPGALPARRVRIERGCAAARAGRERREVALDHRALVPRLRLGHAQPRERRLGADHGAPVRVRAEQRALEEAPRQRAVVVAQLVELGADLAAQLLRLVAREVGALEHVGHQRQRRVELLAQHRDLEPAAVEIGRDLEPGAERVERRVERGARAPARPSRQELAREVGLPVELGGVVGRAGRERHLHAHQRQVVILLEEELHDDASSGTAITTVRRAGASTSRAARRTSSSVTRR